MKLNQVHVELRVGMLDVSLAQLITKDHQSIEFPTLLLPDNVRAGSIVRLTCERDQAAEEADFAKFEHTQQAILDRFASRRPQVPNARVRNVTQTSVVLEWDPIDVASADLHSLSLYKNGQRLGTIPNPEKRTSTKLSNLAIDSDYEFHLELDTSAGVFNSPPVKLRTHKMTDLSGITICVGDLGDGSDDGITYDELDECVKAMGAKPLQSSVKLDTTHFVAANESGKACQRAKDLNIPVVRPEWVKACFVERRLMGVGPYYLTADPRGMPPTVRRHRAATVASSAVDSASESAPAAAPAAPVAPAAEAAETEPVRKTESAPAEAESVNEPKAELPEVEPASDTKSLPETEPASETKPLPETKAEPETETKTEPETQAKAELETGTKTEPETETKTEPETETKTEPEPETETKTESVAQQTESVSPQTEAPEAPETSNKTETVTVPESVSESVSEPVPETVPEAAAETTETTEAVPDPETETETQTQPKTEAKAKTTEPEPELKTEPETEAKAEPEPETKAEPETGAKEEPETETEPETEAKTEPETEAKAEPETETKPVPSLEAETEPQPETATPDDSEDAAPAADADAKPKPKKKNKKKGKKGK